MAVQNRMGLDMLLAERGGACAMFDDMCCTFIPINTAPDGSVTRALEGLRTLSNEMKMHWGSDNPFDRWLTGLSGKLKDPVMFFVPMATFIAILITCGCCCIPCIRALVVRCIDMPISGKIQRGNMYPLLSADQGEMEPVLTVL